MPDKISLAELQEALKADSLGVDEELPSIPAGEDLTMLGVEIPTDAAEQVSTEPIDEAPQSTESVDEPAQDTGVQYLEDLDNTFVKGKVNGQEVEYSLAELRDIRQTQDAAASKLDEYKTLLREARESIRESQPATPAAVEPEDEYMTDEEKKIRALEYKLNSLETNQQSFQVNQLAEAEERHMRQVFERDGLTEAQAAQRIKAIVDNHPDAARFASNLFTSNPNSKDDLENRIATFNTIWELNKTIEMPQVVQRVAQEAREGGINDAKIQAKRNITNLSGGDAPQQAISREDRIRDAASGGQDKDWAALLLEGPMFKNS